MQKLFENWRSYLNEVNPAADAMIRDIATHQGKQPRKARDPKQIAAELGYGDPDNPDDNSPDLEDVAKAEEIKNIKDTIVANGFNHEGIGHRMSAGRPWIEYEFDNSAGVWNYTAHIPNGDIVDSDGEELTDFLERVGGPYQQKLDIFENWRKYQKDTLNEAGLAPFAQRVAMAARPYLNKIGRAISTKAPAWFRSAPKNIDLTIKYGPRLNKIMGSEATGIIKYLHPNDWWAETIMRTAINLGPLHQPAFKLMYGTLMSWNAIRQPAVMAATGGWLLSHLRDPDTQEEFDFVNAAIAAEFQKLLEENPTQEEIEEFLDAVDVVRKVLLVQKPVPKTSSKEKPVPKTSSEEELPPSLKPGAMRFGQKI
jgi:hypothetical protein